MPKHTQKKAIKKVMSKPKAKPSKPKRGQRAATNKKKKGSKRAERRGIEVSQRIEQSQTRSLSSGCRD